jgi:hypothetical protein
MKLLIDANLSPKVAARLADCGHQASHVADEGLLTAADEVILAHVRDGAGDRFCGLGFCHSAGVCPKRPPAGGAVAVC